MSTSLVHDEKHDNMPERVMSARSSARAEWLWTLFGATLLGAFLMLVVEDFPLMP